ncbi:MAG: phosphate signaling complex protein PhoU [Chthoniobacteraceae bacterium]
MPSHFEASLQRDIDRINQKLTEMGARAERGLNDCADALVQRSRQLAYSVIVRDTFIDALDREIDRLCLEFIVRQQPMGAHLRFAAGALKVNLELERIGDYAKSIAKQVLKLSRLDVKLDVSEFRELASRATPLVGEAIAAFIAQDAERARRVVAGEKEVEKMRGPINETVRAARESGKLPFAAFTPLLTISRRISRVADQAKNIAQETIYVATGEYAKHQQSEILRVLFIDTNNAGASQMAEAIGQSLGDSRFLFSSAGVTPTVVDPVVIEFMKTKDIDLSGAKTRAVDRIPNLDFYQVFIALSPDATAAFPPDNARTVNLDWSSGDDAELPSSLDESYGALQTQITDLVQALLGERDKAH